MGLPVEGFWGLAGSGKYSSPFCFPAHSAQVMRTSSLVLVGSPPGYFLWGAPQDAGCTQSSPPYSMHLVWSSSGDLDLRLGFELCDGELEFLDKRKQVASKALQQVMGLSEAPHRDQVWDGG